MKNICKNCGHNLEEHIAGGLTCVFKSNGKECGCHHPEQLLDTFEISSPEMKQAIRINAHDEEEALEIAERDFDFDKNKFEDFKVRRVK